MIKILTVILNSKYRILTLLCNDFLIGIFSLVLSLFILNDLDESVLFLKNHTLLFFTIPLLKVFYFFIARLYSISWRYASLRDIAKTFNTITITMLALLLSTTVSELIHPRMVIIDFLIYMGIFFFSRFTLKVLRLRYSNNKTKNSKKYVIIGAGDAGEMVARELLKIESQDSIIGFFDDNELLHKKTIHQAPVIGPILALPDFFQSNHFDQIIIAIPSASSSEFRKILDVCKSVNVPFLTTPSINELLDNTVKLNKLRDVSIVDLLGRSPINIETSKIQSIVRNQTILITGAGGSIGSELSRQIFSFHPKKVILLDHSEYHLYLILMELSNKEEFKHVEIVPLCLDIKSLNSLKKVFQEHAPSIVFHSAAYKHVPLMEVNPDQAILNNIGGTKNIVDLCDEFNVSQCITISTDKAVDPSNSMGATKRICELITLEKAKYSTTKYCCVRFGNVLGSYGSVIPLFKEQIKNGGPITITDPNMTRYFMTIKEAVSLVFQASSLSDKGGEMFVLDMGAPIKITQLATDLIRLSGLSVDDIPIKITGLRPGEKLTEALFYDFENPTVTSHPKINCCYPEITEDVESKANKILSQSMSPSSPELLAHNLLEMVKEFNKTFNFVTKE